MLNLCTTFCIFHNVVLGVYALIPVICFFKLAMTDFHSFYMFSFALKDFLFSYKTVEGCRQPLHIVQKCKQCLDEKTTTREPSSSTSPVSDHQKYVKGKVL